jgi:CDP-diacylglycerol---serine O-phosphatidyltransferase
VVVIPSAFTLGNLFFGLWAIVAAYNGNFRWAAWFIVFAALLDTMDGRLARRTKTTSRFGEELDSLVDMVSFGVAPGLIIYFLEFANAGRFGWVLSYFYVVAAAVRLARYNVVSAGKPSAWFTGMPSPAAAMTLATFYPFSQTPWYRASLAVLDLQEQGLALLALMLAVLMVSGVKYPKLPSFSFRSFGQGFNTILVGGLPRRAGVRLATDTFLARFAQAGLASSDDGRTWTTPEFAGAASPLEVRIESAIGGVRVEWID